jgi:HsdM N-terminal domain
VFRRNFVIPTIDGSLLICDNRGPIAHFSEECLAYENISAPVLLFQKLKKKVDALWNKFWSAGITNPLVAIEQITYLLFLKRLETLDNDRVKDGKLSIYVGAEDCRWSYIKHDRTPAALAQCRLSLVAGVGQEISWP